MGTWVLINATWYKGYYRTTKMDQILSKCGVVRHQLTEVKNKFRYKPLLTNLLAG